MHVENGNAFFCGGEAGESPRRRLIRSSKARCDNQWILDK